MEAVRTSETSVDNHFTRQYNPEDSSEHHTRRRENLKSHNTVHCGQRKCKEFFVSKFFAQHSLVMQILLGPSSVYVLH
jgi:hypothetical protein